MGDTPTVGKVSVTLKLDTEDAKKKAAEVERKLKANEQERKSTSEKVRKEARTPRDESYVRPNTPHFRALRDLYRKNGGPPGNATGGDVLWAMGGYKLGPPQQKEESLTSKALSKVFGKINPFPDQVSGDTIGNVAPTVALATALYTGLKKASTFAGLGLAYKMKSGEASVKTPGGELLNELNSTFSYINNYAGSYRDASDRLVKWDDAVAAVSGRLPDTQFYLPKFQRQAMFERQFKDMVDRNAALTRAGARGASSLADQLGDAAALGMSR